MHSTRALLPFAPRGSLSAAAPLYILYFILCLYAAAPLVPTPPPLSYVIPPIRPSFILHTLLRYSAYPPPLPRFVLRQATDRLFFEIQELVINSLLAVQKIMIHDKHCFEMYGTRLG